MPTIIKSHRARLRHLLEVQLALLAKSGAIDATAQKALLGQAHEGLLALEYGEAQPIFAPRPKGNSKDGTRPYTLKKLRMQAIGFGDLLIAKKYKGKEPAIRTVAEAYGRKVETYKAWRKKDGKTRDQLMQSYRKEIAQLDLDMEEALVRLTQAGESYIRQEKLAHEKM
jgi:hypothetical protein